MSTQALTKMYYLIAVCFVIPMLLKEIVSTKGLEAYLQPDNVDSRMYDDPAKLPDHICCRPCVKGESKTCYYKLMAENFYTMGDSCRNCGANKTTERDCYREQCVTADGVQRAIITVNRRLPGPSIQVCVGDKLIIDVKNAMGGHSLTIHWHGMKQKETPHMDGVPMVTQCPINAGQIFRYSMVARDPGCHFWHSHSGLQKVDGLVAALVVHRPRSEDPNGKQYDFYLPSHVIVIQDWLHLTAYEIFPGGRVTPPKRQQKPTSYLIQGRGIYYNDDGSKHANTPVAEFHVTQGFRYKFSIIAGTCFECQYVFTIERHDMLIIEADANPCKPTLVNSLHMSPGERYSVVVNCNRSIDSYWMQVRAVGYCEDTQAYQVAILRYKGNNGIPSSPEPTYNVNSVNHPGRTMSPVNSNCTEKERMQKGPCIKDLRSYEKTLEDPRLMTDNPDKKITWVFGFNYFDENIPTSRELEYPIFLRSPNLTVASTVNGVAYMSPPSPLLTQLGDVPKNLFCPKEAHSYTTWNKRKWECVNVIRVPANIILEIWIWDAEPWGLKDISHSIHLHGYDMCVVDQGVRRRKENATLMEVMDDLRKYSDSSEWKKKPKKCALKDTFPLTAGGYCVVRIKTTNRGYWFFHCHFAYHLDSGMSGVLQVGEHSTFKPPPPNFPKCGDYLPSPSYS